MSKVKSGFVVVAVAVAVVALAGCSDEETGHATPEGGATSSGTAVEPTVPALPSGVVDPMEFASRPCDLLTSAQVARLGDYKEPKAGTFAAFPACTWHPESVVEGSSYTVSIPTQDMSYQEYVKGYASKPVAEEAEVGGFPAFSFDGTDGKGDCSTLVGITSRHTFLVQMANDDESSADWNNSCGATEKVAALVLENLKG